MPVELVIGPLLRRVEGTRATVWVETSASAQVQVLTANGGFGRASTFSAFDHHYALVVVDGLEPGSSDEYEVLLDGESVWPLPEWDGPPSVIRTRSDDPGQPVQLVFGSCRAMSEGDSRSDAVNAFARRLMTSDSPIPDLLVLLGDQIYADEITAEVRRFLSRRRRRVAQAPPGEVVGFGEYARLYRESWTDPEFRWLLSTVPSLMIFDDHEIIDDWNTSGPWLAEMRTKPWWPDRIASGLASYWVYQHLGNLAPDDVATDPIHVAVRAGGDATQVLSDFGYRTGVQATDGDHPADGDHGRPDPLYRWSYRVDVGRTRLVMLDDRSSREFSAANRAMVRPGEWAWLSEQVHGDYDHLALGISLPWLLPPVVHHLEGIAERLSMSGSPRLAASGEQQRRSRSLEHWAGFRRSFDTLTSLIAELAGSGGSKSEGRRLASISVLSGDVHHSYVARARLAGGARTPVHQLTSSGFRTEITPATQRQLRLAWRRPAAGQAAIMAWAIGVQSSAVRWRKLTGPHFGTAISTLRYQGARAEVLIETPDAGGRLQPVGQVLLSRDWGRPSPDQPPRRPRDLRAPGEPTP